MKKVGKDTSAETVRSPKETRLQEADWRPFPSRDQRNQRQETLEVPLVIKLLGLRRSKKILEVGCGQGVALVPFWEICRPTRLVGLDIDENLIEQARARLDERKVGARLVLGDVRQMPFPDGSFDIVVDFGTCYHIARPDRALQEIARILGDDGLFIHEEPLNQLLSHPIRSFGRRMPWTAVRELERCRNVLLWGSRRKKRKAAS